MANLFQTCSLIQARLWAGLFIASLSIAACQFTAPAAPAPAATAIAVAMTAPSTAAADDLATIAAATIEAALKSTLPAELATATPAPPPTLAPPALDFAILDEEIINGQAPLRGTGQPGVDVLIVVNGNIVAVAKVQPDGQWSKMVTFDQPGKYSVSVQAMDAAGQQSAPSTPLQLVVAAMSTPTSTPTPTAMPSATATNTPIPTRTPTARPTKIPTAIPTRTPTALPTKTPTPIPTRTPTARPTKTPIKISAPATNVPAPLVFFPISLSRVANASTQEGYMNPPLGDVTLGSVAFDLPGGKNSVTTQAETLPNYPTEIFFVGLRIASPQSVYLLITGGNTRLAFAGRKIGEVQLSFASGKILTAAIIPGKTIREWKIFGDHNVTTTSDPAVQEVWRGGNTHDDGIGIIDMLTIAVPVEYQMDVLTAIEVFDVSLSSVGNMNPAINLIGVTVLGRAN